MVCAVFNFWGIFFTCDTIFFVLFLCFQNFKEETAKLEALIHSKENEAQHKYTEVSNLTTEIQEQKKLIESLQTQLEAAKADKQKINEDSSTVYEEFNKRISEMEAKYAKLLEEKEQVCTDLLIQYLYKLLIQKECQ